MKLLPYRHFYITTDLTPEEIIKRLEDNIDEPPVYFRALGEYFDKPYRGYITGNSFEISRQIFIQKNILTPNIEGFIKQDNKKTIIEIKMSLNIALRALACIWLGFILLIAITLKNTTLTVILSAFLILPTTFISIIFYHEQRHSKRFLLQLFKGIECSV